MLNDSKRRRMQIMEQISERKKSRETSRQRRKKIETNLNEFVQTMSNISYNSRAQSNSKISQNKLALTAQQKMLQDFSPSFKNIKVSEQGPEQALHNIKNSSNQKSLSEQNQIPKLDSLRLDYSPQNQKHHSPNSHHHSMRNQQKSQFSPLSPIKQENIEKALSKQLSKYKQDSKQSEKQPNLEQNQQVQDQEIKMPAIELITSQGEKHQQNNENNSVSNNNSSAIFFTSQFHQFISKDKEGQNMANPSLQDMEQNITEINQDQNKSNQAHDEDLDTLNNMKEQESKRQMIKQQKGQQPANKQNHSTPSKEQNQNGYQDHISQANSHSHKNQNQSRTLLKNKSGHSIAYSNESSLKYSLYESNIKQILTHKLQHQLVVESEQILYPYLQIQIMTDKYIFKQIKNELIQLKLFMKVYFLKLRVQKRVKQQSFDAFLIYQQLMFQEKKNQIKADNFVKLKQEQKVKKIFTFIKEDFFIQPQQKLAKAKQFNFKKEEQKKEKIYRLLKITWYDKKVRQEIDLYYLSKLFSHFKRVANQQKQLDRNKCLNFYYKNMRKRFFYHFVEGLQNIQRQKIQRQNAQWHYIYGTMRKCFDGWKDRTAYKDRYISLAMTTTNAFKETKDHKWLQIKTVDFRQIK